MAKRKFKVWAHFWQLSTGYVQGSKPPRFEEAARRPIPACGTDAYMYMFGSGAASLARARAECRRRGYIGFNVETMGEVATDIRPFEAVPKLEDSEA